MTRPQPTTANRIVIKLGTRVLTHDDGRLALSRLFGVVEAAAALRRAGKEVVIVTSGAVGLGQDAIGLSAVPDDLAERQACAAIGQSRLMGLYQEGFSRLGVVAAQVLLTESDFDDRIRYLNLRGTLSRLFQLGVVPVVNENDVVSTDEVGYRPGVRVFGDNDRLSALVATKLDADLLILLTDVEGLFDKNPHRHPDASLIPLVEATDASQTGASVEGALRATAGRGGMRSKVDAALVAARGGCHVVIASGRAGGIVEQVVAGAEVGTFFPARTEGLTARRRWIAFATSSRGTLHLDAGAVNALKHRGASLLPPGVREVEGEFDRGDIVELLGPDGARVGRGVVYCDAGEARAWCGGQRPDGVRNHHALVHRDHMVLEP